jgi:hypothetical protein
MRKTTVTLSVIAFILCAAFTFSKLPKEFTAALDRAKMTFIPPDGLVETKVIANDQVGYDYAVKYKDKDFEVRYLIMPLDSFVIDYEQSKKDTSRKVIEPNRLFNSMFLVTAMNAGMGANDGMPDIRQFDSAAVKNEFNADDGGTVFINAGKEFGQEYKYCMIVGIHKDNIGDAYIFFLSNTKDGFMERMTPAFHSLKFK